MGGWTRRQESIHRMKRSGTDIEGPTFRFITLNGDPSRAANDHSIRKLVKSNASRSRKSLAGPQAITGRASSSPVPASNNGLISGKSRFALASRKPLKRLEIKIRGPIHDTNGNSLTNLNDSKVPQCLSFGSPKSIQFHPQYSTSSLSTTTKLKVVTMAQHFFSQVVDMQHVFYDLVGLSRRDEAIFHASFAIASV